MGLIDKIAHEHGIQVIKHGSLNLISRGDTDDIIDACKSQGLRILGVEAFWLRNGSVVPNMDAIADFSELESLTDSITEAKRFIQHVEQPDLLFELALTR